MKDAKLDFKDIIKALAEWKDIQFYTLNSKGEVNNFYFYRKNGNLYLDSSFFYLDKNLKYHLEDVENEEEITYPMFLQLLKFIIESGEIFEGKFILEN